MGAKKAYNEKSYHSKMVPSEHATTTLMGILDFIVINNPLVLRILSGFKLHAT